PVWASLTSDDAATEHHSLRAAVRCAGASFTLAAGGGSRPRSHCTKGSSQLPLHGPERPEVDGQQDLALLCDRELLPQPCQVGVVLELFFELDATALSPGESA